MKGVQFTILNQKHLKVVFEPLIVEKSIEPKVFKLFVRSSEYKNFFLLDEGIISTLDKLDAALASDNMAPIDGLIGIAKDAEVKVEIASDKMQADLTITAPYNGAIPSVKCLFKILNDMSVHRGIGTKRLRMILNQVTDAQPGQVFTLTVARGLPPKMGKDSKIKALVPNVIDRILAPQADGDGKVDMRDFGELLCVEPNQAVAKRLPPGLGRTGFTVTGEPLAAQPGKWKKIRLGENVYIPEEQENQVLAKLSGLPKFSGGVISVDDVFVSKGVNVATGNIKYSGAVIVNGDVTENMKIVATGDVTIDGFVESAYIESGGDIVITQGATGKMQDIDCQLIAAGTIFLEHGQGVHMHAGKQINVIKQLAYSNVKCKDNLVVGNIANPLGKLFASVIQCNKSIIAGHVGAVSGSALSIDYSDGYNQLCDRLDALNALFKELSTKNADHEIKVSKIKARVKAGQLEDKMADLYKELELERVLLNWLRLSKDDLQHQLNTYEVHARVIANKALYPGVNIKLNKTTWDAKKEYQHCRISLENGKWLYAPLI